MLPNVSRLPLPPRTPTTHDVETAGGITTVTELPLPVNLALYTGDDLAIQLTLTNPDQTPTDLTGGVVAAQIRPSSSSNSIAATFLPSITGNVITLTLSHTDTQALVGKFVWDCQITSASGLVTTLTAGKATFTQDVTR